MTRLFPLSSDRTGPVAAAAARVGHDLGLAAWFGASCMGAIGLNAATREVDDPLQRNRVANAAWFRWAPYTALSIGSYLAGSFVLRRGGGTARLHRTSRRVRRLDTLQAVASVIALIATAESGRSGQQVVRGGDVPVATAVQPIAITPPHVARAQRRLRVVQWVMPAAIGVVLVANAVRTELTRRTLLGR